MVKKRSSTRAASAETYHHGHLKAALVGAARDHLAAAPPESLSVSAIAKTVGVSSGAPYRHFADREALLRAVALDALIRLESAMRDSAGGEPPGAPRVLAIGRAYLAFARAEPAVFRLTFGAAQGHARDAELQAQGPRTFGVLLDALAQADPDAEPDVIAARGLEMWAFVHGLAFLTNDEKLSIARMDEPDDALKRGVARFMRG